MFMTICIDLENDTFNSIMINSLNITFLRHTVRLRNKNCKSNDVFVFFILRKTF